MPNGPVWTVTRNFNYQASINDVRIIDGTILLPFAGKTKFNKFIPVKDSTGMYILYYIYVFKGPGIRETSYTIINDPKFDILTPLKTL